MRGTRHSTWYLLTSRVMYLCNRELRKQGPRICNAVLRQTNAACAKPYGFALERVLRGLPYKASTSDCQLGCDTEPSFILPPQHRGRFLSSTMNNTMKFLMQEPVAAMSSIYPDQAILSQQICARGVVSPLQNWASL